MNSLRLSLIQMTSTSDVGHNIDEASRLITQAADDGAQLIATPEMTSLLTTKRDILLSNLCAEADDPALKAFQSLAHDKNIWLLIGSLPIKVGPEQVANRSFLIGPDGHIVARYDKIHMFDVSLPNGESYQESRLYRPGEAAVLVETPWGNLGMSVCYDIRFPHLYRELAQAGAKLISVPAAFTRPTGAAHWHILLRARAIETGSFVFAPAQCGDHGEGRRTFGHSLIIDPWGEILAEGGEEPGIISAKLDLLRVNDVRERLPSLRLKQDFHLQTKGRDG